MPTLKFIAPKRLINLCQHHVWAPSTHHSRAFNSTDTTTWCDLLSPLAQMAQSFSTNADWVLIQCRWFKEGCTSLCNLWTTWQRGMWKLCVCVRACLERFKGLMPGFSVANLPIAIIVKRKQSIACQNRFSSIFPSSKHIMTTLTLSHDRWAHICKDL